MIDFLWQDGSLKYTSQEELLAHLEMMDPSRQVYMVKRLEADDAKRTLGVQQFLEGMNKMESKYLTNVVTAWRDEI